MVGFGLRWQVAGSVLCTVFGAKVMIPVLLPHYTKRYYQRYRSSDDQPVMVDDHSLSLLDNVLRKLNFPLEKEKKIDMFVSYNMEPQYHGSFYNKGFCLLGIPLNFLWRNGEELERDKTEVFNRNFPWDYPSAETVKENLLLDDSEKQFLIARQLGYLDSRHVWVKLTEGLMCGGVAFYAGHLVNYKFGLFNEMNRIRRATLYQGLVFTGFCLLGLTFYVLMHDSYMCSLDRYADRYAASLGPEYAIAGVSFYDKVLKVNIAMRLLSTKEKKFTALGNVQPGLIRTPAVPLVARREYVRKLAQEFEKSKQS